MWPVQKIPENVPDEALLRSEMRKKNLVTLETQIDQSFIAKLMKRHSSYSKLIRVIAYAIRFVQKLISKWSKTENTINSKPYLTTEELSRAEEVLIIQVQNEDFKEDIMQLKRNLALHKQSTLKSLNPFLDENGILRVGGRLEKANCKFDVKHPIILHKFSILSKILVTYTHKKFLHPGPSLTFHLFRQRYWLINGRSKINQIVRNCVTCTRHKGQSPSQLMGQLPRVRLSPTRPFENTGIDFTGAISLANKRGRGARLSKGYIAIFICLATKAIHIDVVTDCSTDGFIAALRRFMARRGLPTNIYINNGTNFVGADRKLRQM